MSETKKPEGLSEEMVLPDTKASEMPAEVKTLKEKISQLDPDGSKMGEASERLFSKRKFAVQNAPACLRTGFCCEQILMTYSPKMLRESYEAWLPTIGFMGPRFGSVTTYEDIHLIYPMLQGRCRGKAKLADGSYRFVYGPCKNLEYKEIPLDSEIGGPVKRGASCSIHEHRPKLCRGYPDYHYQAPIQMGNNQQPRNPGYMKGCGFNDDKTVGYTADDFAPAKLEPLTLSEM